MAYQISVKSEFFVMFYFIYDLDRAGSQLYSDAKIIKSLQKLIEILNFNPFG